MNVYLSVHTEFLQRVLHLQPCTFSVKQLSLWNKASSSTNITPIKAQFAVQLNPVTEWKLSSFSTSGIPSRALSNVEFLMAGKCGAHITVLSLLRHWDGLSPLCLVSVQSLSLRPALPTKRDNGIQNHLEEKAGERHCWEKVKVSH